MGVSENSVPLNPMVLLIIIPIKWQFHWEYTLFSNKPTYYYIVQSFLVQPEKTPHGHPTESSQPHLMDTSQPFA